MWICQPDVFGPLESVVFCSLEPDGFGPLGPAVFATLESDALDAFVVLGVENTGRFGPEDVGPLTLDVVVPL